MEHSLRRSIGFRMRISTTRIEPNQEEFGYVRKRDESRFGFIPFDFIKKVGVQYVRSTDGNVTLGKGVYITQTWKSGTSWYRVWSDGYIEQGGFTTTSNAVSLPKPFTTTNYTANATLVTTKFNGDVFILAKTTTTIRVKAQGADDNDYTSKGVSWLACGY